MDELTLWELDVCAEAYERHHGGGDKPSAPTPEEHLDRVNRLRRGANG